MRNRNGRAVFSLACLLAAACLAVVATAHFGLDPVSKAQANGFTVPVAQGASAPMSTWWAYGRPLR